MSARELDRIEEQAAGNKKSPGTFRGCGHNQQWQEREDSNPRPLVLETSALTRLSYAPALITIITA